VGIPDMGKCGIYSNNENKKSDGNDCVQHKLKDNPNISCTKWL